MDRGMKRLCLGYSYAPRSAALGGEDRFTELMRNAGADHVEVTLGDVALAKRLTEKGFSVSFHCPGWWDKWKEGEDVAMADVVEGLKSSTTATAQASVECS